MASLTIRKMPSGSWKAVLRGSRGETLKTKTFDRKENARTWGAEQVRGFERAEATGDAAHAHTFGEAVALYRREEPVRSAERKSELEWWLATLGAGTALSALRSDTIRVALRAYMAKSATRRMRNGDVRDLPAAKSGATANRRLSYGSAVWKLGADHGLCDPTSNPFRKVTRWTEPKERTRALTAEEFERLFTAARASEWSRLYLHVLLAATCGGRPGEVERLRWRDLDLTLRTATVPPDERTGRLHKTEADAPAPRVLSLTPRVVAELLRVRRPGEPDDALVFGSHTAPERPNGSHTPFTSRKVWEEALDAARLPRSGKERVTPYTLRHSYATLLVEHLLKSGVEESAALLAASKLLNHASLQTTRRYFHPRQEVLRRVNDAALGALGALGPDERLAPAVEPPALPDGARRA